MSKGGFSSNIYTFRNSVYEVTSPTTEAVIEKGSDVLRIKMRDWIVTNSGFTPTVQILMGPPIIFYNIQENNTSLFNCLFE